MHAGQRCVEGQGKSTYGSGCFVLVHTGQSLVRSSHGLITTIAYQLGSDAAPSYALEGSIAVAGLGVSWLRDQLGLISSSADSETVALQVPNSGTCCRRLALLGYPVRFPIPVQVTLFISDVEISDFTLYLIFQGSDM